MGTNDQIMVRRGRRYTNTFPNNLNTVNLNLFPILEGYKLEEKDLISARSYGNIYP